MKDLRFPQHSIVMLVHAAKRKVVWTSPPPISGELPSQQFEGELPERETLNAAGPPRQRGPAALDDGEGNTFLPSYSFRMVYS